MLFILLVLVLLYFTINSVGSPTSYNFVHKSCFNYQDFFLTLTFELHILFINNLYIEYTAMPEIKLYYL